MKRNGVFCVIRLTPKQSDAILFELIDDIEDTHGSVSMSSLIRVSPDAHALNIIDVQIKSFELEFVSTVAIDGLAPSGLFINYSFSDGNGESFTHLVDVHLRTSNLNVDGDVDTDNDVDVWYHVRGATEVTTISCDGTDDQCNISKDIIDDLWHNRSTFTLSTTINMED